MTPVASPPARDAAPARPPSRGPQRRNPLFLTWEDYLAYEQRMRAKSLGRHEWVNGLGRWEDGEELGEVRPVQGYDEQGEPAMATGSHGQIVNNLTGILWAPLRGTRHQAMQQCMGIRSPAGPGRYPDVLIAPDPAEFAWHPEGKELTLLNPVVLFEVLSESTGNTDREDKLAEYLTIPSVTDYLIVAQDEPRVEHRRRVGDGWRLTTHADLDAAVTLAEPAARLPLAEVYERVFAA